jgi:pimeloyl-ACP methyl ester carboxylesterase
MPEQSEIFYTDQGKGFPILLIHGFCETHEIWNTFSKELSRDFRVLTIDLPGFGKSELLDNSFSITDVASKVLEWLKQLQIKSCVAIGHSLGGYVTLAMVEQQPETLKAFGLFHSTAYADTEERKLSRNKVIEFVSKYGVQTFIESFIPPLFFDQSNKHILPLVKLASQTRPDTLVAYIKAMRDRPDRTNVLQYFEGHVLFIAGERDGGISSESIRKQAELAAKGIVTVLPEVAHMGMFEDEGTTCLKVRGFMREVLA